MATTSQLQNSILGGGRNANLSNMRLSTGNSTQSFNENTFKNSLLSAAIDEFYTDRPILISNLPVSANEDDVDLLLGQYAAKSVEILHGERKAVVVLRCGNEIEQLMLDLQNTKFQDSIINVELCETEKLLCCAHLPHEFTLQQFKSLVSPFDQVKKCFLYRAQTTGDSKWIGIVEFCASVSQIENIRNELDWKIVENHHLHCDFLDKSLSSYRKLNSKCLFVDNLPKEYTNTENFREVFSLHSSPLYCQIVMKDGSSLGYGIIEYRSWQEAEKSERHLNGHVIMGVPLRITYCIPGISAVSICTRLMSKFDRTEGRSKPSLLPDPVQGCKELLCNPLVERLNKQHPLLMTKFDEALQKLHRTYVKQLTSNPEKPGLLGPAPAMPINPLMTVNLQLGLVILLAIQMQLQHPNKQYDVDLTSLMVQKLNNQSEKPSLLGDPYNPYACQSKIILQNLVSQLSPGKPDQSHNSTDVTTMLLSISHNLHNVDFGSLMNIGQLALQLGCDSVKSMGLLGDGPGSKSTEIPALLDIASKTASGREGLLGPAPPGLHPKSHMMQKRLFPVHNERNVISNQLDDARPSLLGEPPTNNLGNWNGRSRGQGLLPVPNLNGDGSRKKNVSNNSCQDEERYYHEKNEERYYHEKNEDRYYHDDGYYGYNKVEDVNYNEDYQYYRNSTGPSGDHRQQGMEDQNNKYQDMAAKAAAYAAYNSTSSYGYDSYGHDESYSSGYSTGSMSGRDESFSYGVSGYNTDTAYDCTIVPPPPPPFSKLDSGGPMQHPISKHTPVQPTGTNRNERPALLKTPQGQKRGFSHLLPPPEPSPEGNYVGQHSQGIGGHYAESYSNKRQKVSHTRLTMQY